MYAQSAPVAETFPTFYRKNPETQFSLHGWGHLILRRTRRARRLISLNWGAKSI